MAFSRKTGIVSHRTKRPSRGGSTLVKPLAPEELHRDQYVTVLDEIAEVPSFYWCADAALLPPGQAVRIRLLSDWGGLPLRVRRVCLPFVLVKQPCGARRTLDVRKCRLAKLGKPYAREAWRAFKKNGRADRNR
jgi:hypothetical protein